MPLNSVGGRDEFANLRAKSFEWNCISRTLQIAEKLWYTRTTDGFMTSINFPAGSPITEELGQTRCFCAKKRMKSVKGERLVCGEEVSSHSAVSSLTHSPREVEGKKFVLFLPPSPSFFPFSGRRFNRKKIGLSFGLKYGLRFHFDSETCPN